MTLLYDEENEGFVWGKELLGESWMGEMRSFVMLVRSERKDQSLWVLVQMGQWEFDVGEWFLVKGSETKAQGLMDISYNWFVKIKMCVRNS